MFVTDNIEEKNPGLWSYVKSYLSHQAVSPQPAYPMHNEAPLTLVSRHTGACRCDGGSPKLGEDPEWVVAIALCPSGVRDAPCAESGAPSSTEGSHTIWTGREVVDICTQAPMREYALLILVSFWV